MFCEKCGKQLNDTDRFCKYCGAEVIKVTASNVAASKAEESLRKTLLLQRK